MIRTVLASPWLPMLYWGAAVIAMICGARHESLQRRRGHHEFQRIVSASISAPTPIPDHVSIPPPHLAEKATMAVWQPTAFWYPQIAVFQRPDFAVQRLVAEVATKKTPIVTEVQAPITMLSIRVEPPEQNVAKTLAIHCRTSMAISNARGRTVPIYGVVTQEVVSSSGKILIMAGSKVVGSGLLDPENGRFKSDGLWSIFFDDTELKVQAQLLDRPAGLPGMLGQETSNENEALQREAVMRDGRSIFVPQNATFVLEIHGEILLRDINSNQTIN
jgi:hypothetical protein